MAGKVVTTAAPTKQETAGARSYVGNTARSNAGSARVQEKVGGDARNVNYYKGSAAYSASHPGTKFNNYDQRHYMDTVRGVVDRDREIGQLNDAYDYLNSGNTNRESTSQWINMANERAQNAKDEDIRGEWMKLANNFGNQYQLDSYTARENNLAQIAELDKKIQDVTNKARSASDVITYWDSADGSKPSQERANYLNYQLKQLNFQKAALEQDNASIEENFYNVLATDEEKAAISALKEGKYGNIEKLNLGNALGKVFGKDNVVTGNGRDKNADLATAQAFYDRIGMQMPAYFNNRDAWGGKLEGTVQSIAGNYVSAAGLFDATAKDQADILLGNKEATGWDTALGILSGGHYALQGLVAKGRDKLLGAGQEQIGSLNRPEDGSIEALWDAYNNAKTPEERAAIQETLNAGYTSWLKNIGLMQGRVYENSAWLENFSKATTAATGAEEIAALESEYREREAENKKLNKSIREARVIAEKYNGDSPSYWYALRDGTAEDRADALLQLGFKLDNEGKTKQQGAESTVGPIERRLMQAAGTALEIGTDAAVAGITGGGPAASKFSLGLRVFGGTGKQAIDKGASISQATLYGYAKASAEIITEAMFDFAGGLVYGKSFTGDLAGEIARRLSDNPIFRRWIIKGLNVFGEGAEEGASDFLGIPIEMIIDYNKDQTFWQNLSRLSTQELASFWEDMLMGSFVALLGMPLGDISGTYKGQVAETYVQDVAKDEEIQGKIEDERDARVANTAKIQGENFDRTAIDKMMDEKAMEAAGKQSTATKIAQKLQVLKYKQDSGAEITENDLLTKDEFNIAVAAGWVSRNERAQLSINGDVPTLRDKLEGTTGTVVSKLKKPSKFKGRHRQETIVGVQAQNAGALGYGEVPGKEESHQVATGKTMSQADAEVNNASRTDMENAGADNPVVPGGDAAGSNYSKMNRDQLTRLWLNGELTHGQYADWMERNGFWTKEEAIKHLAEAKYRGADAESRRRNTLDVEVTSEPVASGERMPARPQLPDTHETTKSEGDRIIKEISENDTHREADHRPVGNGRTYWVKSKATRTIQEIWNGQRARLAAGKQMSRDAQFETYTGENGEILTLPEAAEAEENGKKVYRWRAIEKNVVDAMLRATPEDPYVLGTTFMGSVTAFKFDGTNLTIMHGIYNDQNGSFSVLDDKTLPAGSFEQAAIYLTQSSSSESYSHDSIYLKMFDDLEQFRKARESDEDKAPEKAPEPEGTPAPPEEEKTVKPQAETPEQPPAETKPVEDATWSEEELGALGYKDAKDVSPILSAAKDAAKNGNYLALWHSPGTSDPSLYVYDGKDLFVVDQVKGKLSLQRSGIEALKWLDSPKVAHSLESWRPSELTKEALDKQIESIKNKYEHSNVTYTPTKAETKKAFDDFLKSEKNDDFIQLAKAIRSATPDHPFAIGVYKFDGSVLREYGRNTGAEMLDGRVPVVSGVDLDNNLSRIVRQLNTTLNSAGALPNGVSKMQFLLDFITESNNLKERELEKNEKTIESANSLVQSEGTEGGDEKPQQTAGGFEPGKTGRNPLANKQYFSRTPLFTGENAKELTDVWTHCAKHAERAGGRVLTEKEVSALPEEVQNVRRFVEDYFGIPMTFARECVTPGFSYKCGKAEGLFVDPDHPEFALVVAHELGHILWKRKITFNRASIAKAALVKSNLSDDAVNGILGNVLHLWGGAYIPGFTELSWRMLRPDQQLKQLQNQPDREEIIERFYEELSNVFFTNDLSLAPSSISSLGDAPNLFVRSLIDNGIMAEEDITAINNALKSFGFQLPSPAERSDLKVENPETKTNVEGSENYSYYADGSPKAPGRRRESQDKSDKGTHGEKRSMEGAAQAIDQKLGTGDGTYISNTNEERSEAARQLTEGKTHEETIKKQTEQYERLLKKEKGTWTDEDVVIAQKLRNDFLKAVRDYQMNRGSRMKLAGYLKLAERYNALTLRHKAEKSATGQKLQAEYNLSIGEKILNRAALSYLGFSSDGTFNITNSKNVKIYAAMEDAVNRIGKAVEAKNPTAVAQICKDISDIRGVKRMFGPMAEFASNMENDILSSIAKQDNGLEALQTLAYGNLNAMCDDVQPYKALNAAKTIRIMNMLSNMSTIINNVTNNIASGLTSTNALSQWATQQASKAFEGIAGQPVVAKAQKGWLLNKDIRNAEWEALKMATLVQMYGVNQESGKLELSGDKGLFNPNSNMFEQTMALYKFFIGMGVEATDQVKSAGLQQALTKGIDDQLAAGKITEAQAEAMRREAKHEVDRLLYKDDNALTARVQIIRDGLNKLKSWGNDDIGTIGLGDIAMAFAKVPANVVRARLLATPEGCLFQVSRYVKGVMKAKRMHSEVLARQIMESHANELSKLKTELQNAYDLNWKEVGKAEKQARIDEIKQKIDALNRQCWNEARAQCGGGVYNRLSKERANYGEDLSFDAACKKCGYADAEEMSQFEMASYSRAIGKAATSAGMVVLGAVLRALGALKDFDNEPDDELRKMYAQKGYKGLMMNLSAIGRPNHEWRDGDNIVSAEFLEVVALPLAIGACAADSAAMAEEGNKGKAFLKSVGYEGLGKAFEAAEDIPGMADAIGFYNAFNNQFKSDNAANGNKLWNSLVTYAAGSIPSFFIPNAATQFGAGMDNTVRDVYNTDNVYQQAWNIMKNKTGYIAGNLLGLRKTIPASVDMWGEERTYGENKFWGVINKTILPGDKFKYRQNKYESEIIRLVKAGYGSAVPKISVSGSFEVGDETYTMDAEEKRTYKQNRNTEQAEFFKAFIDSDTYNKLTDAQKEAVFKDLKMECERDAKQTMLNDRGLDVEVTRAKWETELNLNDQIQYLGAKQMAGALWDKSENSVIDFSKMDEFIKGEYKNLSDAQKKILNGSYSHLDDLADAAASGVNSEKWQAAYNIYQTYTEEDENGKRIFKSDLKNESEMWAKIKRATGFSDGGKQMKWIQEHMELTFTGSPNTSTYDELVYDYGMSRESAAKIYNNFSTIQPTKGYADVQDRQKWVGLTQCGLSDKEQWDSFFAMVPSNNTKQIANMKKLQEQTNPDTGKKYTFQEAIHKLKLDVIYWKEVLPNGKEKKHEIKE